MNSEMLQDSIDGFYEAQFREWPEVAENYRKLAATERRSAECGDLRIILQHNPERGRSTFANVDSKSVAERPCFLCRSNRPKQQIAGKEIEGFEILVNPYPIFPVHFTIAAKEHDPQGEMPLDMVDFVSRYPSLAAFYNGAESGASAPDHLHFQAVLKEEIPLLALIEQWHSSADKGARLSSTFGKELPAHFISLVIAPDFDGLRLLGRLPKLHPGNAAKINSFVWIGADGLLRCIIFPRKAHRPSQYFSDDETERLMVSPGAIDMAGVMILPRREDFNRIGASDISDIYRQTGVTAAELETLAEQYGWTKED